MRYALTAEQMRAVEERVVAEGVTTLAQLMEHAGEAVSAEATRNAPDGLMVTVTGPGNNGGDGWVAARRLLEAGLDSAVIALAEPSALHGEAADAARAALEAGVPWQPLSERAVASLSGAAVVVDAVFGFGFHGPVREPYRSALEAVSRCPGTVISVDVPSGVEADTGMAEGAVRADVTVTFTALKPGLLIHPGAGCAGEVVVADIGVPRAWVAVPGALEVPGASDLRPVFPLPRPDDHKGSRGRVAVVAGSTTYPGAAVLAARGALALGAGFTVAVVPEPIADILRASAPGILVRAIAAAPDGSFGSAEAVLAAVADADAVVAGPGLTTGGAVPQLVHRLIAEVDRPLLLDADGLNALDGPGMLAGRRAPVVIAPHPGEAARLLGSSNEAVQHDRLAAADALCGTGMVCLLKGARTLVTGGGRRAVIVAGNAGLAKAGSGDVLAGMIGTLLAQGVDAYDAAVLGAHLHGRAADHGVRCLTTTCFTSADITTFLPDAVREVTGE